MNSNNVGKQEQEDWGFHRGRGLGFTHFKGDDCAATAALSPQPEPRTETSGTDAISKPLTHKEEDR